MGGAGSRFKLGIFIGATLNAVVGVARAVSGPQHSHNILPTQSHRHTFSSILGPRIFPLSTNAAAWSDSGSLELV